MLAAAVRAGVTAAGLRVLASNPSNAVTAATVPAPMSADALRDTLWKSYGIKLAGGQDQLKGKIIRVGHLGAYDVADIVLFLGALEEALRRHGQAVAPGAALGAVAFVAQAASVSAAIAPGISSRMTRRMWTSRVTSLGVRRAGPAGCALSRRAGTDRDGAAARTPWRRGPRTRRCAKRTPR